jgi:hypothetical protein
MKFIFAFSMTYHNQERKLPRPSVLTKHAHDGNRRMNPTNNGIRMGGDRQTDDDQSSIGTLQRPSFFTPLAPQHLRLIYSLLNTSGSHYTSTLQALKQHGNNVSVVCQDRNYVVVVVVENNEHFSSCWMMTVLEVRTGSRYRRWEHSR